MRFSVIATIFFNVFLCVFIYFNTYAVPDFRKLIWTISLQNHQQIPAPSLAIIQSEILPRAAVLEDDQEILDNFCDFKEGQKKPFDNQRCFSNFGTKDKHTNTTNYQLRYLTFDGSTYPAMSLNSNIDLWYKYSCKQFPAHYSLPMTNVVTVDNSTPTPLLQLAIFDTDLLKATNFSYVLDCADIATIPFPARDRNSISLQRFQVIDGPNAMDRPKKCNIKAFRKYYGFTASLTPLGLEDNPGPNNCNSSDPRYNGSCNADLTVDFLSLLTTVYTSSHGKDWKTMLTDEGGITGFVGFFAWFLGIFEM